MKITIDNNNQKISFEGEDLTKYKYLDVIKTKNILEHIAKHENKTEHEAKCLETTLSLLNDLIENYYIS